LNPTTGGEVAEEFRLIGNHEARKGAGAATANALSLTLAMVDHCLPLKEPLMKSLSALLTLAALTLILPACAHETPNQTGLPKGKVLVKQLPAGVEGVELKDGALRLKPGFTFVKKPRHRFAVARISNGQTVTTGGCGCTGGTCDPTSSGGIIVCEGSNCTGSCGLALTVKGVNTRIIEF
jgi:hypothetical protein